MGSYLSIQNDTTDTWLIKVGKDEAAGEISGWVITGITALASAIASGGSTVGVAAGVIATASATSTYTSRAAKVLKVASFAEAQLQKDGYDRLAPGATWKYGKLALSLWQQCVAHRIRREGNDIVVDKLFMRPIFSGATDNSERVHRIQWWLDKWGVQEILRAPVS